MPIGTEWTITSTKPDGTPHGASRGTEAEAVAYAKELHEAGHTKINVQRSTFTESEKPKGWKPGDSV